MKVKILSHTPEPEKVISMAAKLCYSAVGVDQIEENLTPESIDKFLNMLISIGHESPLEHVSFTFAVEGISRACSHQIVRHRIASYSQQSQRYVKLNQFEYIIPHHINEIDEARELFIETMKKDQEAYDKLVEILFEKHYNKLIQNGKNEKEAKRSAEKQAIEDARYVFPNACETKMVFTMNVRSLYNFLNHRCCERAQWEIRELAIEMLRQLKQVAPILFRNMGYDVLQTNKTNDGGIDCILNHDDPIVGGKVIAQVKRYKNNIDIPKLREFESVLRNSDAMKGIFISTSNFSSNCEKFASDNNISLINGNLLVDYFNQYGINSHILHK